MLLDIDGRLLVTVTHAAVTSPHPTCSLQFSASWLFLLPSSQPPPPHSTPLCTSIFQRPLLAFIPSLSLFVAKISEDHLQLYCGTLAGTLTRFEPPALGLPQSLSMPLHSTTLANEHSLRSRRPVLNCAPAKDSFIQDKYIHWHLLRSLCSSADLTQPPRMINLAKYILVSSDSTTQSQPTLEPHKFPTSSLVSRSCVSSRLSVSTGDTGLR